MGEPGVESRAQDEVHDAYHGHDGKASLGAHATSKIKKSQHGDTTTFETPLVIAPTALKEIEML